MVSAKLAQRPAEATEREIRADWWQHAERGPGGLHLHPLTGQPCDYYWYGPNGPEPRWRGDVYRTGKDRSEWWYTTDEVAAALNVSRWTIANWVKQGRFPGAVRFGPAPKGKLRIQGKDIEAFLRANSIAPRLGGSGK